AAAVPSVETRSATLVERCLELALDDPDEEVRRAAGAAFAKTAEPDAVVRFTSELTLSWTERGRRVRALATDLASENRTARSIPVFYRILASRERSSRIRKQFGPQLSHALVRGMRARA